jgi:hypothetical protein
MSNDSLPISPALDFPALQLSADDLLPTDILMLLAYRNLPDNLAQPLAGGLRIFPHLTGRIDGSIERSIEGHGFPSIVPNSSGSVSLEMETSEEALAARDFPRLSLNEHLARFAPAVEEGKLIALRRVNFHRTGVSALCLRVSHMALDGTGLGLFLAHATAAARGVTAPPVTHVRSSLLGGGGGLPSGGGHVPEAHVECPLARAPWIERPDRLAATPPRWITMPLDAVTDSFGGGADPSRARNRFAAWLCTEISRIAPHFRRLAIWCNSRGRGGAPPTFTGNAGCYLHRDITGDEAELAKEIQRIASREGLARARQTHQEIIRLRESGREVWWDGPHEDLLQLNLLSPPVAVADFGSGRPIFALLLSRNSSGLRIFPSVCGTRLIVEATLAEEVTAALVNACAKRGLTPHSWGGGDR